MVSRDDSAERCSHVKDWPSNMRRRYGRTTLIVLLALAASCGSPPDALDLASADAKSVVVDIDEANPPTSYRFKYTAISPVFMACMSGVEDIEGVVDAEASVMVLTTTQRTGDVYSLEGELLIHRDLLDLVDSRGGEYARVRLDATSNATTRNRIDDALGTSFSALIAGGAWPNHPTDVVRALMAEASSVISLEPARQGQRRIRILLDADAYTNQIEGSARSLTDAPPIIDVHVAADGTIERLVARLPDPNDPSTPAEHGDGYAMDYDYGHRIATTIPDPRITFDLAADELPPEPTPILCRLEQ